MCLKMSNGTGKGLTRKILSLIEDQGPTNHVSNWHPNPNFHLQYQKSYGPIHMQKVKVKGHLV